MNKEDKHFSWLDTMERVVIYNTGGCNEHPGTPKGTDEEPLAMNAVSAHIGVITAAKSPTAT